MPPTRSSALPEIRALITDKIKGRTVDFLGIQGSQLVLATTDGQMYRIGWRDKDNELVPGSPSLEGIDMKIIIDPVSLDGTASF